MTYNSEDLRTAAEIGAAIGAIAGALLTRICWLVTDIARGR